MNEDYKSLLGGDLLDHTTLNITLKELTAKNEHQLAAEIQRILNENKIEKALPVEGSQTSSIVYYVIDLPPEDIDKIVDLFYDLEEAYVDAEGNKTPTSSFYERLGDKWNNLTENEVG